MAKRYLESEPGPDLLGQNLGDDLVKGGQDLHSQLWLDAALVDQVVKRIREGQAETSEAIVSPHVTFFILFW